MKCNKFTTRTELKSLRKSIECAEMECESLRMFKVCLVCSSMRLGVPFIAPRQLGAVGGQQGRLSLPFCRVAHQTVRCTTGQPLFMSGARSPSYSGADGYCISGPDGAPDSLVPHSDRWRGPRVARGLRGRPLRWRPLAHRTVRCTTGQSGEL